MQETYQKKKLAWQNILHATSIAEMSKQKHAQVEQDLVYLGKELGLIQDQKTPVVEPEVVEDAN